jgi:hypothetical protein
MLGLPTETMQDIEELAALVREIHSIGRRQHGRRAEVSVSLATFIPKPHTPFQWEALEDEGIQREKLGYLRRNLRIKGIALSWPNPQTTLLEAALSRGDRRLGRVIHRASRNGARFDAWDEAFRYDIWQEAFAAEGLDPHTYASRPRSTSEVLPWSHIHCGVNPAFLQVERERAFRGETSSDCRSGPCLDCGTRSSFDPRENEETPRIQEQEGTTPTRRGRA